MLLPDPMFTKIEHHKTMISRTTYIVINKRQVKDTEADVCGTDDIITEALEFHRQVNVIILDGIIHLTHTSSPVHL